MERNGAWDRVVKQKGMKKFKVPLEIFHVENFLQRNRVLILTEPLQPGMKKFSNPAISRQVAKTDAKTRSPPCCLKLSPSCLSLLW
jgi:hypothetical protein